MEKNMKVHGVSWIKPSSSLVMTLILISILSAIFLFWNHCYKVQIASYHQACQQEKYETALDLAMGMMKHDDQKRRKIPIIIDQKPYLIEYYISDLEPRAYMGLYRDCFYFCHDRYSWWKVWKKAS